MVELGKTEATCSHKAFVTYRCNVCQTVKEYEEGSIGSCKPADEPKYKWKDAQNHEIIQVCKWCSKQIGEATTGKHKVDEENGFANNTICYNYVDVDKHSITYYCADCSEDDEKSEEHALSKEVIGDLPIEELHDFDGKMICGQPGKYTCVKCLEKIENTYKHQPVEECEYIGVKNGANYHKVTTYCANTNCELSKEGSGGLINTEEKCTMVQIVANKRVEFNGAYYLGETNKCTKCNKEYDYPYVDPYIPWKDSLGDPNGIPVNGNENESSSGSGSSGGGGGGGGGRWRRPVAEVHIHQQVQQFQQKKIVNTIIQK